MSAVYIASTGAAAAAAKAAKAKREEEEQMTTYNNNDLEGWEFKIVRSNTSKFKDYQFVQQVCQEEARAGWELMEKFDDNRIRFKRRTDKRRNDQHLDIDPYRTTVGMTEGKLVVTILSVIFGIGGIVLLLVFLLTGKL